MRIYPLRQHKEQTLHQEKLKQRNIHSLIKIYAITT